VWWTQELIPIIRPLPGESGALGTRHFPVPEYRGAGYGLEASGPTLTSFRDDHGHGTHVAGIATGSRGRDHCGTDSQRTSSGEGTCEKRVMLN